MTQPAPQAPEPDETIIQVQVGLAELPTGQRVAVTVTALLPKEGAEQVGKEIIRLASQMSSSGLFAAVQGGNGLATGR